MKAPFNPRTKDPRKAWEVKEDPAKLDAMYNKFLGKGGEKALTEEIKWLAVTHKSFDQGRRGFNDRLAYFGKQLLTVECTLALLLSPGGARATTPDAYGREPFQHPDLEGLQNLDSTPIHEILSKQRLAQLATSYGIGDVTRWKPRNPANLAGSGSEVVYATSLYAILGALALQKGGAYAKQIARERVLKPLGI
jgi:large subunit ribosomal protein L15